MPNGLFALDDVPRELCEEKLADFLVLNHADHVTTMYRNVFRVPPAHVIQVKSDGSINQHRYWSPADVKPVRLPSDAAYADGLRECLDHAVRRQMRSSSPGRMSSERRARLRRRFPSWPPVPSPTKTNGLSPSPVCHAAISMAPYPHGCYADEAPVCRCDPKAGRQYRR